MVEEFSNGTVVSASSSDRLESGIDVDVGDSMVMSGAVGLNVGTVESCLDINPTPAIITPTGTAIHMKLPDRKKELVSFIEVPACH